ncbi:MAG TPA: aspartate--tRNA ligase [Candidatus Limnocylindrales bacterium]|nr:aspartate--tRNA ligase [Candidatus Limnocylindrales bacterium]
MTDQTAHPAPLRTSFRDLTCGEARAEHVGRTVSLAGWVHRRRDMGQLIFIDLRDRHGITQVVVDAAQAPEAHATLAGVRNEFVLAVAGEVTLRLAGTENPRLATGEIELRAVQVRVLSAARTPPFPVNDPEAQVDEALRLKHRYLDLRREQLNARLVARSRLLRAISEVHHANGFVEVETPILIKSTPEGARDFIVPSRLQPGNVYALPQSPQQLKQLLMVAGFDRYFQIAHCMRDEDMRADRGPEFTQLDLEMSFVDQDDVMAFVEKMVIEVSRAVVPERPIRESPFPRFTFRQALDRFGSDKPDVRFGMELVDVAAAVEGSGFRVFDQVLTEGGRVMAFTVPGMADASRSQTDELVEQARRAGAKGLVHIAVRPDGLHSPVLKALGEERSRAVVEVAGGSVGDLVLVVADRDIVAQEALGELRVALAERLGLIEDREELSYVWVNQFPMYSWDEENRRWDATHNPFSGVMPEDEELLATSSGDPSRASPDDPAGRARALQHDIALNGWELGGGSIRIHRRDLLERSFALMGHTVEGMRDKFGALLDAFEYGAPPHGGIALGIDRWAALLLHQHNIREVMAFPKTGAGSDLMLGAPSPVDPAQLEELGLALKPSRP